MYDEEKIKKFIKGGLRYIFVHQKEDKEDHTNYGGVSPYPEDRESAGTIATSDVVTCFFLLLNDLDFYPDFKSEILNMKIGNSTTIERIGKMIKFLLNSQILNANGKQKGGFPPKGDIYNIRNVAFSDSTAVAVVALLHGLKNIEKHEEIKKNVSRGDIEKGIKLGINWLINNFSEENLLPTYIWKKGPMYEKRLFPLLFTGIAFLLAKNEEIDISKNEINEVSKRIVEKLTDLIEERRHIPFNLLEEDSYSFFNTCMALQLLKWEGCDTIRYKNIVNELNERIKKSKKSHYYTDFDRINTSQISEVYPFYDATYSFLPCNISTQVIYDTPFGEVEENVRELIDMAKKNDYFCCYEDRGEPEIAISATASGILALGKFLRRWKIEQKK